MTKFLAGEGGEGEAISPIPPSRENPATLAQNFTWLLFVPVDS